MPDQFIGSNVEKVLLEDGRVFWSINCVDYLNSAIENVNNAIGVDKMVPKNYVDVHRPYPYSFRPESDVAEELGDELPNGYHQLIGVLRWSI